MARSSQKENTRRYRNFLFDLYGTLADIHTDEGSPALWLRMSALLGMEGAVWTPEALEKKYRDGIARMEAEARKVRGCGAEIDVAPLFRSFYTDAGVEASEAGTARLAREFRVLSLCKLRLFPGAAALLKALRENGCRVFLLSNAQALFTRPELRLLGLDTLFDDILLSSEAGLKKPDAGFYGQMLTKNGLDPAETVMVGNDDQADCHGAAAVGLDSLYLHTEQSPRLISPLPENCVRIEQISDVIRFKA